MWCVTEPLVFLVSLLCSTDGGSEFEVYTVFPAKVSPVLTPVDLSPGVRPVCTTYLCLRYTPVSRLVTWGKEVFKLV